MKIPFETVGGIILLDVTVNGKSGQMAFDTGAMQTCLNKSYFADAKGSEKQVSVFSGELKAETTVAAKCTIKCREWETADTSVLMLDMDYVEKPLKSLKADIRFLGTVGYDVIGSHKVLLDYADTLLTLDEEISGSYDAYDMRTDVLPVIDVDIDNEKYKFVLDTGANTCLLDAAFGAKGFKASDAAPGLVDIPRISALGREYSDTAAVITDISAIKAKVEVSGVIGYQILKDNVSFFDFAAGDIRIYRS